MNINEQIQKFQANRKSNISKQFIPVKEEIQEEMVKADENPFEKAAESEAEDEDKEFSKAEIYEALNQGRNITIKKTGKELKENINSKIIPQLNADLEIKKNEADEALSVCGVAPTKPVDYWYTRELNIDVPYKIYDWEETYFEETKNTNIVSSLSVEQSEANKAVKKNYPESKEIADNRRIYNSKVREVCEILVDLKSCEIVQAVEDKDVIELTPKQYISFQF